MAGIECLILRGDHILVCKKTKSSHSHFHYGLGSFLNIPGATFDDPEGKQRPWLIFQEYSAVPLGAIGVKDQTKEIVWKVPVIRSLATLYGRKMDMNLSKYINMKTLPIILIGLGVLYYLLTGGLKS